MECIYINLDEQTPRRTSLETDFRDNCPPGWRIRRLCALGIDDIERRHVEGTLPKEEKACFLSHLKALELSMTIDGHVFVAEDDILFGKETASLIDQAIETLSGDAWDMLFTDVCIPGIHAMIVLFQLRQLLSERNRFQLIDLKSIPFAASTGYIVNHQSKDKVYSLLKGHYPLNTPLDLLIRTKVSGGELHASVVFPFATSLSKHADDSQVQVVDQRLTKLVWNSFRRSMWVQRDLESVETVMRAIEPRVYERQSAVFSKMVAAMLSRNLPAK